jgi:CIC family chloride channel protein
MRSPLTGVVFALELTHDQNVLLPLLVTSVLAHGFTVLTMKRSILTEKVARRGFHLTREYSIDPLEILFVREVMRTNIAVLSLETRLDELPLLLRSSSRNSRHFQTLYPVVDSEKYLRGVVTWHDIQQLLAAQPEGSGARSLASMIRPNPAVAYADETLRQVVFRMAETGLTRFPVVNRSDPQKLAGIISLEDLLHARERNLEEERRRERILRIHLPFGKRWRLAQVREAEEKTEKPAGQPPEEQAREGEKQRIT